MCRTGNDILGKAWSLWPSPGLRKTKHFASALANARWTCPIPGSTMRASPSAARPAAGCRSSNSMDTSPGRHARNNPTCRHKTARAPASPATAFGPSRGRFRGARTNYRRQRLNGDAFQTDVTVAASRNTGCRRPRESVSKARKEFQRKELNQVFHSCCRRGSVEKCSVSMIIFR